VIARPMSSAAGRRSTNPTLEDVIREEVRAACQRANWKLGGPRGAAARLGLKRTTLFYMAPRRAGTELTAMELRYRNPVMSVRRWRQESTSRSARNSRALRERRECTRASVSVSSLPSHRVDSFYAGRFSRSGRKSPAVGASMGSSLRRGAGLNARPR
jgi:hypothetical protein